MYFLVFWTVRVSLGWYLQRREQFVIFTVSLWWRKAQSPRRRRRDLPFQTFGQVNKLMEAESRARGVISRQDHNNDTITRTRISRSVSFGADHPVDGTATQWAQSFSLQRSSNKISIFQYEVSSYSLSAPIICKLYTNKSFLWIKVTLSHANLKWSHF